MSERTILKLAITEHEFGTLEFAMEYEDADRDRALLALQQAVANMREVHVVGFIRRVRPDAKPKDAP